MIIISLLQSNLNIEAIFYQWRIPGTTSCGSGRARALGMPCRAGPLAVADCVARRRVRVFVNICSGIFGVLRGESARAPHRVNAFRTLRVREPTTVYLGVPRIVECPSFGRKQTSSSSAVYEGGTKSNEWLSNARRRVRRAASRRVASRRANLAERTSSGVRDCSSNGDTCVRPCITSDDILRRRGRQGRGESQRQ